jgi:hypothetical protein
MLTLIMARVAGEATLPGSVGMDVMSYESGEAPYSGSIVA